MKKVLALFVVICLMMASFSLVSYADDSIKIKINGYYHEYDVMPLIVNSRTLVPMRGIFESLGADISWDGETKTVRAFGLNGAHITHIIGESNAVVNGDVVTFDTPSQIVNGRTMVPVRFVSEALGEKVDWDADTKTVIIGDKLVAKSPALATLKSTVHRPVPTTFTRSKELNDVEFYSDFDTIFGSGDGLKLEDAKVILSPEEFLNNMEFDSKIDGVTNEIVDYDGEFFTKGLRVNVPTEPEKDTQIIGRFNEFLKDRAKEGDALLIKFTARCISTNADDGLGKIKIQLEAPETFKKALFSDFTFGENFQTFYASCKMGKNTVNVGVRFGYNVQCIEVADFGIYNFGEYPLDKLPNDSAIMGELAPGAQWREEANKRIEQIRKGDFKVIVKDKDGNVIPDAKIKADMFEHEFQFGSLINKADLNNNRFRTYIENYNSGVFESITKMGLHDPEKVRNYIDGAKEYGIKYFRGHSIVWEKFVSKRGSYLMPKELEDAFNANDKEKFDQIIKDYMKYVIEFYPEMKEWDVANEIIANKIFREKFGEEYLAEYMKWMHDINPDIDVLYNENSHWGSTYWECIDMLKRVGAFEDIDKIGLQSHYTGEIKKPTDILALYDKIANEYGVEKIRVTEYSTKAAIDEKLHGDFNRDFLIATFSHPNIDGIYMWGHWSNNPEGASADALHMYAPLYDHNWNLKKGGQAYQDLVYNKWWTNEQGTTNTNGEFGLRGFYGDYDVTVEANGQSKTVMVAFHKGYDNILEITMD